MKIGLLTEENSGVKTDWRAFRIGTKTPLPINKQNETEGCSGWSWDSLLNTGVDLCATLSKPCYLDHVHLHLSGESGVSKAEILDLQSPEPYRCIGKITSGPEGLLTGPYLTIPVGRKVNALCVRLHACLKEVCLSEIQLVGSVWEGAAIYPTPKAWEALEGSAGVLSDYREIRIGEGEAVRFAAERLAERLEESGLTSLPIKEGSTAQPFTILLLQEESGLDDEGYTLHAGPEGITLRAASVAGLLYGAETLAQLLKSSPIPACLITDGPRMAIRGLHMGLPPREEIPFFKRMVRCLLSPMRMNTLFLQFTAGMRFDRHPELNEAWLAANNHCKNGEWPKLHHCDMVADGSILTKDEVRELVAFARAHGLEVVPEIQSLSHVQYITLAHPELAEVDPDGQKEKKLDERLADQPPTEFYKHSCCPQNEGYYTLLWDIIDEIVEVVEPKRYVHMGHDEVYQIGICPKCREKDPSDLLALHINRVHAYLAGKNLKMMIWGDMLQPSSGYKTPKAIDKISNDITLLDFIWYFHPQKDLEDNLLPYGFPVVMGNLYSSHYTRYEKRAAKQGIVGGQTSTWCRPDEKVLGREGKLYDILYCAQMMWSGEYRSDARFTYNKLICGLLPEIRGALRGEKSPSLRFGGKAQAVSMEDNGVCVPPDYAECLETEGNACFHGLSLPLDGPRVVLPGKPVTIPVSGRGESLLLGCASLQTVLKYPWEEAPPIGTVTVLYEDGQESVFPILYGEAVGPVNVRYATPMKEAYYRHTGYQSTYFSDPVVEGKTFRGEDVTLYGLELLCDGKRTIKEVTVACEAPIGTPILLGCAGIVKA